MSASSMMMDRTATRPEKAEAVEKEAEAQIVLQPIAFPSILGLFGFAGATFVVAANLAGWYGTSQTPDYLFPFAAFFGGLAQFLAGMWAYKARDGLATAMHGMWGSFWMAYGVLNFMFATGTLTPPVGAFPALGFWFIALAWITWVGMFAATGVAWSLVGVLGTLAVGSTLMAIGQLAGGNAYVVSNGLIIAAGWVFIISAVLAWYTASALMINSVFNRTVLPVGVTRNARRAPKLSLGIGEPGVQHGQ
jgi:succinate-acetate transporter protein